MRRRTFVAMFGGTLLIRPVAGAGRPNGHPVLGWLVTSAPGPLDNAFRHALAELGYAEGKNITIEWHWAKGDFTRLPTIAEQLVKQGIDVILAGGTPAALAVQKATRTIPIVMVAGTDPVQAGLVASLAHPGANITGVTRIGPELAGKRLELLVEAFPTIRHIAVLWHDATNPYTAAQLTELERAATRLGVQLQPVEIHSPEDLDGAFAAITRQGSQSIVVIQDGLTLAIREPIMANAAAAKLPAMYETRDWTEAGGLVSFGASDTELYRRAAYYVDKILKGAEPAELPVEQPSRFELIVNLKTAGTLGLTMPQAFVARADEVIE